MHSAHVSYKRPYEPYVWLLVCNSIPNDEQTTQSSTVGKGQ